MNSTTQSVINGICIDDHLALAYKEAKRARYLARGSVELDELISIATVALCQAAKRFEGNRGIPFEVFARFRIRGHLTDGIGASARVPRKMLRNLARDRERGRSTPLITHVGYDDEHAFPHLPTAPDQVAILQRRSAKRLIASLPVRSAKLLSLVYLEERTLAEAADRLGISESSACRLRQRCIGVLRSRVQRGQCERLSPRFSAAA